MDITLLTKEQISGKKALPVLQKYGTLTGLTDLAILLGAGTGEDEKTIEGDPTGYVWTSSIEQTGLIYVCDAKGKVIQTPQNTRWIAVRPVLPASQTSKIKPARRQIKNVGKNKTVTTVEYGMYPQMLAPLDIAEELEDNFKRSFFQRFGFQKLAKKSFSFDNRDITLDGYKLQSFPVYEKDGKSYIRIKVTNRGSGTLLSSGKTKSKGKAYWVEIQPIEWLVDNSGAWIAKKALFSGMGVNHDTYSFNDDFDETDMKKYLMNTFAKEMRQCMENNRTLGKSQNQTRKSPYNIEIIDTPLPVKDQINFYVRNGMSFMLHGPSGIGKTARVEQIDPDLTAIPLWNGVLPEDVVGKVRYPDGSVGSVEDGHAGGVWVAPDWYTQLCQKCAAEPNKKHVLFIDEVTNAKPTTQSLIFHIVLKKSITPSKGKLPENAVVVLAGNNKEESGAAYNMPEPLFRRMSGHIYLKPDLPAWLEWGSEKSQKHPEDKGRLNIHPLVAAFVSAHGQDVFYSAYDEEEPKEWAIDPRGWEQVSDVLYDNRGQIRRELLENKMGPDVAAAFLAFANNPPLSLEEVLDNTYMSEDIPNQSDSKLALALSLRHAMPRQVGTVRRFIEKELGKENLEIFDSVWVGEDDERALLVNSLKGQGKTKPAFVSKFARRGMSEMTELERD